MMSAQDTTKPRRGSMFDSMKNLFGGTKKETKINPADRQLSLEPGKTPPVVMVIDYAPGKGVTLKKQVKGKLVDVEESTPRTSILSPRESLGGRESMSTQQMMMANRGITTRESNLTAQDRQTMSIGTVNKNALLGRRTVSSQNEFARDMEEFDAEGGGYIPDQVASPADEGQAERIAMRAVSSGVSKPRNPLAGGRGAGGVGSPRYSLSSADQPSPREPEDDYAGSPADEDGGEGGGQTERLSMIGAGAAGGMVKKNALLAQKRK